jgi:hypothetical protein
MTIDRVINLLAVVAVSFGLQVWSHHNAMLAKFLKTSLMSFDDCLMILAVSTVGSIATLLDISLEEAVVHFGARADYPDTPRAILLASSALEAPAGKGAPPGSVTPGGARCAYRRDRPSRPAGPAPCRE